MRQKKLHRGRRCSRLQAKSRPEIYIELKACAGHSCFLVFRIKQLAAVLMFKRGSSFIFDALLSPVMSKHKRLCIAGVEIDVGPWDESLDKVMLAQRYEPVRVYFANAHCVNIAHKNSLYREALKRTEFVFNDGVGVEIASKILGQSLPSNLGGTDWIPALFDRLQVAGAGVRVYLLGGRSQVVEASVALLTTRWPVIEVVGWRDGYFANESAVLADIERGQPDILLVAMGVPKQELFIDKHWQLLKEHKVKLAIAGGAILDFITGAVPRAPGWIRRAKMEWAYRLWIEPKRLWKRYLYGNMKFFYLVMKQWASKKWH